MKTNEYGLVPGRAIKNFDMYKAGQLCGFEPHVAQRLVASGRWVPTEVEAAKVAQKAVDDEGVKNASDEGEKFLVGVENGTVQVPANWRTLHHTQKKNLAAQISGKSDIKVDEAEEIIAEAVKDQEAPQE